jgi:hypothetical protein
LEAIVDAEDDEVDRRQVGLDQATPVQGTPNARMRTFLESVRPPDVDMQAAYSYLASV